LGVEYGILAGVALYIVCRQCHIDVGELKQIHPLGDDLVDSNDRNSEAASFDVRAGQVAKMLIEVSDGSETDRLLQLGDEAKQYHAALH
jgi:hypothetical protein